MSGVRRGLLGTSRVDAKITSDNENQLGSHSRLGREEMR